MPTTAPVRDDAAVDGQDDPSPIAIVDVGYDGPPASQDGASPAVDEISPPVLASPLEPPVPTALAACVVARGWTDAAPIEARVVTVAEVRPYAPGRFYERELPCVLAVLERLRTPVGAIVVDGYVVLDEHGTPGLGGHLHAALGGRTPV